MRGLPVHVITGDSGRTARAAAELGIDPDNVKAGALSDDGLSSTLPDSSTDGVAISAA
jgi:cation transport ATPase